MPFVSQIFINKLNFLIFHLEGKRHDAALLRMSDLLTELQQYAVSQTGEPFCLYGDQAYPLKVHLQTPYQNAHLTADQKAYNKSMSEVRVAVEWVFGDISTYFAFMDYRKNLKVGLSPIGKMYIICALLRNALTCLYGNSTSEFFGMTPPTIQDYFQI